MTTEQLTPLKCLGIGRDAENPNAVVLCFNRPLTDDELRAMHRDVQRYAPFLQGMRI